MKIQATQKTFLGDFLPRLVMNDNLPNDRRLISFKAGKEWNKSVNRSATLLPQIGKLIGVRYGGPCTDDDAVVYYEAALPYLIDLAAASGRTLDPSTGSLIAPDLGEGEERFYRKLRGSTPRTVEWLRFCTPGLVPINDNTYRSIQSSALAWVHDRELEVLEEWHDHRGSRFADLPFGPDGRSLGKALSLHAHEMRAGSIKFLSPIDRTADELKAERRAADAHYRRARRDQAKTKPQSSSVEALRLWEAIDVGRRKFYKLRAAGELPALPEIPRGADPAPYIAAFALVYRTTRATCI